MDAKAKSVREILHSGDQFLVPFFQRFYSWHRTNWERLSSDLLTLLEDPSRKQHFLGPLVCAALNPVPGEPHAFQLIDGQQRLTTLSLILAALRDIAHDKHEEELAAEINETYLIHRFRKGWQQLKLVPRTGDREAFASIIRRQSFEAYKSLGIIDAYEYFRKSIRQQTQDRSNGLRELYETIVGRLYLVVITIGEENPYEIFESLNSTGLPLEESDLIRNFVFMKLPADEQGEFHDQHWKPYEQLFEATGDWPTVPITPFCRDFLMRDGAFSRLRATFLDFKLYYERTNQTPYSIVTELSRFAKFELAVLRGGPGYASAVAAILSRFPLIETATAHPLLLHLLGRLEQGTVDQATFVGCVRDVESFVVRRTICGEQTGAYGRWFCEVIPQLGDNPRENLRGYLLHRGWPDDAVFQQRLLEFPLYRRDPKKCKLLLELLERSFEHKELVDLKSLQIEHVMPQTIPAGKAGRPWREMLGEGWKAVHAHWLHSLGNLTLTGYNLSLSNRPFGEKRDQLLNSNVSLNKYFGNKDKTGEYTTASWNEGAIRERGTSMATKVCKLLVRPEGEVYQLQTTAKESNATSERRKAYWAQLIKLLEKRQSPWLPIRASEHSALVIHVPAYDVTLEVKLVPGKHEIVVRLGFSRDRGRQMYSALHADQPIIDQEFKEAPHWSDGESPELRVTLKSSSIRDPLDWLDQHEWIADRLLEFHRTFFIRLASLHVVTKEAKPHAQQLFEFWCGFHNELRKHGSEITGVKPLPQVWNDFALGRSNCFLEALRNSYDKRIAVHLVFGGKHSTFRFQQLIAQKADIESEIGMALEWHCPPDKKQRHVILRKLGVDPSDRDEWPALYDWLRHTLEQFHKTFQPRIKALPADPGDDAEYSEEVVD